MRLCITVALIVLLLPAGAGAAVSVKLDLAARADHNAPYKRATLTCGKAARGTGWARRDAAARCRAARRLANFLGAPADPDRICTQEYGGPAQFRVRGHIGGERINRRFDRRNGCAIDDFKKVRALWRGSGVPD